MTLYYNKNTYELKDISDDLIIAWRQANNPKSTDWILAPEKTTENAEWNNGLWIIPEKVIPSIVSARQIRLWLIRNGISLQNIADSINNIQDQILRDSVAIEWEYAPYIERNHPMLVPLANSLGLTEADIDRAFIEASLI